MGIGGDISSRDMIGKVPAPGMRPRAGTWNSRHSARNSVSGGEYFYDASETTLSVGNIGGGHRTASGVRMPLTPAQETEEYMSRGHGSSDIEPTK
jgi:hypothetical protein